MKHLYIAIAAALVSAPALATTCTFTTECFEAEACADSAFTVAIEEKDGATRLVSDAETIPVSVGGSDAARVYVGVTDSAFHLMSSSASGVARYSTHLYDGPIMVNYLGSCEGAE
ncbi:hypothetical protein [Litoreibacter arenae]|uniref:Uncharacterized protein n=1 Tax=Litoreibacter arenae DSM 19593 TaxID=1123360 RepID=S9RY34_9RHOB|nr:hypothetical protein [Litoreibacter arenae]EPX78904.1 hypothetical protein thalar_01719 [Litoreibacter arenae DSM 19593]